MPKVILPERCDRAAAEALLPELAAHIGAQYVEIDGSAVRQVGQATLQLLVSARRSCERVVITASAELRDAAAMIGLTHELFDEAQA